MWPSCSRSVGSTSSVTSPNARGFAMNVQMSAHCRREIIRDPDLTLKGLRYLYEANRPKRRHP